jgi:hypothetical protein
MRGARLESLTKLGEVWRAVGLAKLPAAKQYLTDVLAGSNGGKVRKMPSWPRSWANFSLYSCIPTGMDGPTCTFWANLTPFSLKVRQIEKVYL